MSGAGGYIQMFETPALPTRQNAEEQGTGKNHRSKTKEQLKQTQVKLAKTEQERNELEEELHDVTRACEKLEKENATYKEKEQEKAQSNKQRPWLALKDEVSNTISIGEGANNVES